MDLHTDEKLSLVEKLKKKHGISCFRENFSFKNLFSHLKILFYKNTQQYLGNNIHQPIKVENLPTK
jgi:hypothetical protein